MAETAEIFNQNLYLTNNDLYPHQQGAFKMAIKGMGIESLDELSIILR